MGISWVSADVSASYDNKNTNSNSVTNSNFTGNQNTTGTTTGTQTGNSSGTGTYTPNLSDYWKTAYGNVTGAVGPGGATPEQQTAIDFVNNQLKNSSAGAAATTANGSLGLANNGLGNLSNWWNNQVNNGSYTLGSLNAKAQAGTPGYETYAAPSSVSADKIVSQDALSKIPQYSQFYDDKLIDPSLKAFDYGTDRAFSALDARTAAGGGFANERSGLGYSDLGAQSALGRGQLYSGLKNLGLTNAAGLATGDVNRNLSADTTNAANSLQAQEFNANMLNNRQQFDVGAAYQGDQMRQTAANGAAATILQQAGITQQVMNNVLTANGVDTNAAAALFQAGAITYGQLQAVVQAAQAANGGTNTNNQTSSQTGTQTSDSNTNTSGSGTSTTDRTSKTTAVGGKASVGF